MDNPHPLNGPIVLARVYSQPRSDEPRFAEIIGFCIFLYSLPCLGVVIAALIHRDFSYLSFLALGTVVWQAGFWHIKRLRNTIRKRAIRGAYRQETTIAIVERLAEMTALQAFGQYVFGKGNRAWLTDKGIYFDDGSYLPWEWFQSFDIDVPEKGTHRVLLKYIVPERHEASLKRAIRSITANVSLFMIAASCIFLAGGFIGYRTVGLRLDVLANFLFSVLPLPVIATLSCILRAAWPKRSARTRLP